MERAGRLFGKNRERGGGGREGVKSREERERTPQMMANYKKRTDSDCKSMVRALQVTLRCRSLEFWSVSYELIV